MRKLLLFVTTISILTSCQKNEEITLETKSDYLPLSIGNYWVYQHYKIDTDGNETLLQYLDSIVIKGDTIIKDEKFFIIENHFFNSKWTQTEFLRDSSKNLVNNLGHCFFSETNFTDVLYEYYENNNIYNDTLYSIKYQMHNPNLDITVPAGSFNVLNYKGDLEYYATEHFSPLIFNRTINTYYAPQIGKILTTYYFASLPDTFEKRLTRYKIVTK
ncbi:MAG TPA: hypothetical protein PL017_13970 [Tenuifilaceae bacterium]|nr:hypothetical protein [Tenuifilaceae bacterium]